MKKIIFVLLLCLFIGKVEAGQIIERHDFYDDYDPASYSFVYDDAGATTTGDQVAVNTYLQKSIQITGITVGEDIEIQIQGRSKDQLNTRSTTPANWAVLDTVNFGAASADEVINQIVDVTEFVDFLRVGIKTDGATGTSRIDIEGIFTNLQR